MTVIFDAWARTSRGKANIDKGVEKRGYRIPELLMIPRQLLKM